MKLQQPGGQAKKKADKEKMKDIETDTPIIYRIAKNEARKQRYVFGMVMAFQHLMMKKRKKHGNRIMKGY